MPSPFRSFRSIRSFPVCAPSLSRLRYRADIAAAESLRLKIDLLQNRALVVADLDNADADLILSGGHGMYRPRCASALARHALVADTRLCSSTGRRDEVMSLARNDRDRTGSWILLPYFRNFPREDEGKRCHLMRFPHWGIASVNYCSSVLIEIRHTRSIDTSRNGRS
jgi:hypothetical protein